MVMLGEGGVLGKDCVQRTDKMGDGSAVQWTNKWTGSSVSASVTGQQWASGQRGLSPLLEPGFPFPPVDCLAYVDSKCFRVCTYNLCAFL